MTVSLIIQWLEVLYYGRWELGYFLKIAVAYAKNAVKHRIAAHDNQIGYYSIDDVLTSEDLKSGRESAANKETQCQHL